MTDTLEGELYEARNEPFLSAIDVEIGFASTKVGLACLGMRPVGPPANSLA